MQATRDKALKPSIVITELPYQTNKSDFVATVARLVEEQKLTGWCQVIPRQACSFAWPARTCESSLNTLMQG